MDFFLQGHQFGNHEIWSDLGKQPHSRGQNPKVVAPAASLVTVTPLHRDMVQPQGLEEVENP